MKGVGNGPGEGEIEPPVVETMVDELDVRADALREEREEEDFEARIAELEARIVELEGELAAALEALGSSERRHEIERAAHEANALDAATVALLTEIAVSAMEEPDVRAAIEELRRDKPFLFRGGSRQRAAAGAMSVAVERGRGARAELGELADEARSSGDRGALLAYLRERRGRAS
ncbi:MAG: hypothetical protein RIB60_06960 [Phycisphaerales bacterium]